MASISLGGSPYYPTEIAHTDKKIGTEHVALDGSYTFLYRAIKRGRRLVFKNVSTSVRDTVRSFYTSVATFVFTDEDASTFTAIMLPSPWSVERVERGSPTAPVWNVECEIREV